MKQTDSKDKSSVVYIGKGMIILSIIITASLSFVLGFFVGKSVQPQPLVQTSVLPPQNVEPAQQEAPVPLPAPVQETAQTPVTGQTPEVSPAQQGHERKKSTPADEPLKNQQAQKPQETKKLHPAANSETSQDTRKDIQENNSRSKKYAVQVEAFKQMASAKSLKEKLNRKGYNASVSTVKTKKHEKFYKVIVGDFQTRKEADALSAKLKQSENLQHAFVIPKND